MEYQYCPKCGKKYEDSSYKCQRCNYTMYQNPVPAVGGVIYNSKKQILMVKRAIDPYKGKWEFVGGFIENGEDAKSALRREISEELHISAKIGRLLLCVTDAYGENGKCTINIFYLAYIKEENQLKSNDEIMDYQWFSISKLPKDIAFNCTREVLNYINKNRII